MANVENRTGRAVCDLDHVWWDPVSRTYIVLPPRRWHRPPVDAQEATWLGRLGAGVFTDVWRALGGVQAPPAGRG